MMLNHFMFIFILVSKKVNFITTSNNVLCHFVFEEIDNFPQLLVFTTITHFTYFIKKK